MRKPTLCLCENKGAYQLRGDRATDQHLCFRYIDSTIPLTSLIRNFRPLVIVCGCTTQLVSETPKTDFLVTQLILWKIPKFSDSQIIYCEHSTKRFYHRSRGLYHWSYLCCPPGQSYTIYAKTCSRLSSSAAL